VRNHGWKVEGTKVWVPTPPRARPKTGLGIGCGRVSLPSAVRVRGITPGKFWKTQMLNPAFWWLLAVKFLAFWKPWPRSWRDQYIGGDQLRLLRLSWTWQGWLQHECLVAVSSMQQIQHARRRVLQTWFAPVSSRTYCISQRKVRSLSLFQITLTENTTLYTKNLHS